MQLKIVLNALAVGASVALFLGSIISSSVDPLIGTASLRGSRSDLSLFIVIEIERIFFFLFVSAAADPRLCDAPGIQAAAARAPQRCAGRP